MRVEIRRFSGAIHKSGQTAAIFGKNSADFTRRFPTIAAAILVLPVRSCIIDGELIAADAHGGPDFLALLHGRRVPVCVYAFDLIDLQGRDLREQPLVGHDSFPDGQSPAGGVRSVRPRRHRAQAEGRAIPNRLALRLGEGENGGVEGGEPLSGEALRAGVGALCALSAAS
jgi:hypothetical protein